MPDGNYVKMKVARKRSVFSCEPNHNPNLCRRFRSWQKENTTRACLVFVKIAGSLLIGLSREWRMVAENTAIRFGLIIYFWVRIKITRKIDNVKGVLGLTDGFLLLKRIVTEDIYLTPIILMLLLAVAGIVGNVFMQRVFDTGINNAI